MKNIVNRQLFLCFTLIGFFSLPGGASCYECLFSKVIGVNPEKLILDVNIQPKEAIKIAEPFLDKHATKITRAKKASLHIVLCDQWYYIMKTDYPAKTLRYYLQPAVKVHTKSGNVSFSKACK